MAEAFFRSWEILFPNRKVPKASQFADGLREMHEEMQRVQNALSFLIPLILENGQEHDSPSLMFVMARLAMLGEAAGVEDLLDLPFDEVCIAVAQHRRSHKDSAVRI